MIGVLIYIIVFERIIYYYKEIRNINIIDILIYKYIKKCLLLFLKGNVFFRCFLRLFGYVGGR